MASDRRPSVIFALVWLATLVAGCAAPADDTPPASMPAPTDARSFVAVPEPSVSTGALEGVPAEMLSAVVAGAARGAGVDPSEVEVIDAESITWSDGSLGCPEPGMAYTQALVPGYRVILQIGGEELAFHSDASGEFRFCENPMPGAAGGH